MITVIAVASGLIQKIQEAQSFLNCLIGDLGTLMFEISKKIKQFLS